MGSGLFDTIFVLFVVVVIITFITKVIIQISTGRKMFDSSDSLDLFTETTFDELERDSSKNYDCPHCGAALGEKADVSPSGDVKCLYCKKWFNIHQKS